MMKFDLAIRRRHFRHFSSTSGDDEEGAVSDGDDTEMSGLVISESGLKRVRSFNLPSSVLSSSSLSSSSSRKVMSAISGARFELSASMTFREFIHRR